MSVHWPDQGIRPGFWLGPLGALAPLPDLQGDLSVSGYPRDWTVTIPQASPAEVANLHLLAGRDVAFELDLSDRRYAVMARNSPAMAKQSLQWVTPYSRVTNLLPPRSVEGPGGWLGSSPSQGGSASLSDGMAMSSVAFNVTAANSPSYSPLLPVVPGMRVTAAAYARKATSHAGTFRLDWMAVGAAQNASPSSSGGTRSVTTTGGALERLSITATVPGGVHVARLTFLGVPQVVMPSFTWTETLQDRSAGMGVPGVVVHNLSSTPRFAWEGTLREDVSFTVSEVG